MAPASVNTMSRNSQILQSVGAPKAPLQIEGPNAFDLREFVSDEDAVNFNSAVWDSIDQTAYVLAQRDALEAFNVAKAIRLSKETAAVESKRRSEAAASSTSTAKSSVSPETQTSASSSAGPSSATQSQPIVIRKSQRPTSSAPAPPSDEAAAISLARSWRVDSLQPALLENNSIVPSPKSTQKSSSVSATSTSHHHHPQQHHYHERQRSSSIVKQPSQNLSLSTSSSFLDSRIASDSTQIHSRATQPNVITSSSASHSHRIEQRTVSKREPEPSSISMSPPSSSQAPTSDVTNTKRRRYEHQTSTSTTSSHNTLVAPSISHSKRSTASARDVRLGQMINPINERSASQAGPSVEKRSQSRQTTAPRPSEANLFTATRMCAKCAKPVDSPRTQPSFSHDAFASPFSDLLHVKCSSCKTNHCRGCFTIHRCPSDCTGGTTCTVRNCCSAVRAIAIFEALSSFDHIYATEAGFAGQSGNQNQLRQTYVARQIAKADKSTRTFHSALVFTLRVVCSWLQPESGFEEKFAPENLHSSVAKLFASSYLPGVMHAFLTNTNVGDWIQHSDTYGAILDALRCMVDCGLKELMMHPLVHIERSPGLHGVVWDQQPIVWEMNAANRPVERHSLWDMVKQLEKYREVLMAFGTKVNFAHTVEKVNKLFDGISYLLLQQVVGGL